MSLYREARARRLWPVGIAAAVGILVGLGIGLVVSGSGEPELSEALEPVQEDAREVLLSLELVPIEYEQGGVEAEAASSHVSAAVSAFDQVEPDLVLLDPGGAASAEEALGGLQRAVGAGAPPEEIERLSVEAAEAVASAAGIDAGAAG